MIWLMLMSQRSDDNYCLKVTDTGSMILVDDHEHD